MHFLNLVYFYHYCNHVFSSGKIVDFTWLWKYLDRIFVRIILFFPCLAFSMLSTIFLLLSLLVLYHIIFYLLSWTSLIFYIHYVLYFLMNYYYFIVYAKYYNPRNCSFDSLSLITWLSTFLEGIFFKWLKLILHN